MSLHILPTSAPSMSVPTVLLSTDLRDGKWTKEEENYCNKLIECFEAGLLDIPPTTPLSETLSKALHCDESRIVRKYHGIKKGKRNLYGCMASCTLLVIRQLYTYILAYFLICV